MTIKEVVKDAGPGMLAAWCIGAVFVLAVVGMVIGAVMIATRTGGAV